MSSQAVKILEDAMQLNDAERADLAACLFASLDQESHDQLDPAWEAEIQRRLHAIDNGQATMVSWEEAQRTIFGSMTITSLIDGSNNAAGATQVRVPANDQFGVSCPIRSAP